MQARAHWFSWVDGLPAEVEDRVRILPPPSPLKAGPYKGQLLLLVQGEGEGTGRQEVCDLALRTFAEAYQSSPHLTVTAALRDATRQAARALYAHNREVSVYRKGKVHLCAAVLRAGEVFLCQVGDTQAFLAHKGEVLAVPEAWTGGKGPSPLLAPSPLGTAPEIEPDLVRLPFAPGDLLLLVPASLRPLFSRDVTRALLVGRSAEEVLELLGRAVRTRRLEEAYGLLAEAFGEAPVEAEGGWVRRLARLPEKAWVWVQGEVGAWRQRRAPRPPEPAEEAPAAAAATTTYPDVEEEGTTPLPQPSPWVRLGERLAWWRTRGQPRRRPVAPLPGRPALASRRQEPWRVRLVFLAALVALLAVSTLAVRIWLDRREEARFRAERQRIEAQIEGAFGQPDVLQGLRLLDEAEVALGDLEARFPDRKEVLEPTWEKLWDARDRLQGVTRLKARLLLDRTSLQMPEMALTAVVVREGKLYLLDRGQNRVHMADLGDRAPVLLPFLGPEFLEGAELGPLEDMTWREEAPLLMDRAYTFYLYDPQTARWQVGRLGAADLLDPPQVLQIATYLGRLYVLGAREGQILRYEAGAYDGVPTSWVLREEQEKVRGAVDLAVDGRIYLLWPDGRVRVMESGAVVETWQPEPPVPVQKGVALYADPDLPWLYLLDQGGARGESRVLVLDKETGERIGDWRLPRPWEGERLVNLWVDGGRIYLISAGGAWEAPQPVPGASR